MKLYLLQVSSQNMDKAALEQLLEETRHDRCIVALVSPAAVPPPHAVELVLARVV